MGIPLKNVRENGIYSLEIGTRCLPLAVLVGLIFTPCSTDMPIINST